MHVRGALSRPYTLVSRVLGRFYVTESCAHEGPRLVYVMSRITLCGIHGIQSKFSVKRMRVRQGI